jgi:hypothetical protein
VEKFLTVKQDPYFNWHFLTEQGFVTLRDLTIRDLLWLRSEGVDLSAEPLGALLLYNRLVQKTQENYLISDFPISRYRLFLSAFIDNVMEGKMCTVEEAFKLLWILGGRSFNPEVEAWLDVPMTLLVGLANTAKELPGITL